MPVFFLMFLLFPFLELALLIKVGAAIGVLPTLLLIIGSAVLGSLLLRVAGLATALRAREKLARGEMPEQEMLEGMLIAVGGGGLIAGTAAYYGGDAKLIGVEPETAPTLHHALAAGEPVDVPVSGVAADSLGARRIGATCFALREHIDSAVLVSDEAIITAQKALWNVLRIVAEPGGAAAFAGLLSGAYRPAADERVCVVLCGANTAPGSVG